MEGTKGDGEQKYTQLEVLLQTTQTGSKVSIFRVGMLYMFLGSVTLAIMPCAVKFTPRIGTFQLCFLRSSWASVASFAFAGFTNLPVTAELRDSRRVLLFALRGLAGGTYMVAFFFASKHIPLGDAVSLAYTAPFLTAVLGAFLFNEKFSHFAGIGSVLSIGGVLCVTQPTFLTRAMGINPATPLSASGMCAGIAAGILNVACWLSVRALKDVNSVLVVGYASFFTAMLMVVCMCIAEDGWQNPTADEALPLLIMMISGHLGQYFMTVGLAMEHAGKATTIEYLQVVWSLLLQVFMVHEQTDLVQILGCVLICSWAVVNLVSETYPEIQ